MGKRLSWLWHAGFTSLFLLLPASESRARTPLPVFDADRAYSELKRQCAFGPRNPGSTGHSECRDYLANRLKEAGGEVLLQPFDVQDPATGKPLRLTNIIARFPARKEPSGAPKQKNDPPPLMLCAHWDTRPRAEHDPLPSNRSKPIPGANDGASGVAVLLEVSRLVGANPPPRPIIIAFFDGEDLGREGHNDEYALGSKFWASHPVPEMPAEAILLDMIGDADLEIPVEFFSERYAPHLRRRLWQLARELDLPAFVERPGPPVEDDHLPLIRAGIPAVDLIDFDYPYWHTLADTPDKCSPASLGQVGRLLVHYIYEE
ncbi:MAG: M28 family peptidase [Calditrichaeota bacterium]|nr:M28 family peptidase [Calditrichota bacterium]